jgi:predicted alpha/beta hydrolase family esterase
VLTEFLKVESSVASMEVHWVVSTVASLENHLVVYLESSLAEQLGSWTAGMMAGQTVALMEKNLVAVRVGMWVALMAVL